VLGCGNAKPHLVSASTGNCEVRVPTDAHRLNFVAYVLRYDCAVDCILTKIDANGQISRGEPVSAEVARVNMRCD
jgi:hypothetical protein